MQFIPEAPTASAKVHTAGVAATAAAIDLGASDAPRTVNIICTQAFNVTFNSTATITDPADNSAFPANTLLRFRVNKTSRFLEFTPVANCVFTHWLDRV